MTAWVQEQVVLFPVRLERITIGKRLFLFVVALYVLTATVMAFIIGQSQAISSIGGLQTSDPQTLLWADRLTGWFSIAIFMAFVCLTNATGDNKRREKIVDAIAIFLGVFVPQIGYNAGWALRFMEINAGNPLIQQLASSVTLTIILSLWGLAGCYWLSRSKSGNKHHNQHRSQ